MLRSAYKTKKKEGKKLFFKDDSWNNFSFYFFLRTKYNETKLDPVWDWIVKIVKKVPWVGFVKPKKGILTSGRIPVSIFA